MTDKQKLFVSFYLSNGLNATQAAVQAGYSERTARQIGARLLSNVDVKNAITEKLQEVDSKAICQTEEILKFLSAVVRGEVVESVPAQIGTGKGFFHAELLNKPPSVKDRINAAALLSRLLTISDSDKSDDETLIILPQKNPKI